MGFRPRPTPSSVKASPLHNPRVLALLALLLVALAPMTTGQRKGNLADDVEPYVELRCRCPNVVSGIPLRNIASVNVLKPGAHCANLEVIATLKDGRKTCLDPDAPAVKKLVMKILEGY
ncbi:platelet basic protein [Meriones unguiculatus]|uniref:platelet basic protein n=1 Tax=Meriones unguiculatus TaxID=10047 RepID=UPI000B4F2E9D|nr:platelet basic protein [Meriones unguiculatus]